MFRLRYCWLVCVVVVAFGCSSTGSDDASNGADTAQSAAAAGPSAMDEADEEQTTPPDPTATATVEAAPLPDPTATTEAAPLPDPPAAAGPCGVKVTVAFRESAPRDTITITNNSDPQIALSMVAFDLSTSVGEVIFDTVDGGAGVEVFQDFQVESGDAVLAQNPVAEDGASSLVLEFVSFDSGQSLAFSIDVDDQLTNSDLGQIQVSGAELAGAQVRFVIDGGSDVTAVFDTSDTAAFTSDC